MATPFSPFVGRINRPALKRRQSELPSDLIDWDAPEISIRDLWEKDRIINADYIRFLEDEHAVESVVTELLFEIAHDSIVDEYTNKFKKLEHDHMSKIKKLEHDATEDRSKVNLLLGQIRMFESKVKEGDEHHAAQQARIEELENELEAQKNSMVDLEQERENWHQERDNLKSEIENLNFRNNETICELNHNLELYIQKKGEAEEYKKKMDGVKNQLAHYKRLAKSKSGRIEEQ